MKIPVLSVSSKNTLKKEFSNKQNQFHTKQEVFSLDYFSQDLYRNHFKNY
jgi:hypothetical protein